MRTPRTRRFGGLYVTVVTTVLITHIFPISGAKSLSSSFNLFANGLIDLGSTNYRNRVDLREHEVPKRNESVNVSALSSRKGSGDTDDGDNAKAIDEETFEDKEGKVKHGKELVIRMMQVCSWSSMDFCSKEQFVKKLEELRRSSRLFAPVQENLIDMLAPISGERIVGVGCGEGNAVFRVARLMSGGGLVMGIDNSEKLIDEAERVYQQKSPNPRVVVVFRKAQAQELMRDIDKKFHGTFSGAMMKRVLVHSGQAARIIGQLARMVRVGGRIVVAEPDWGSFKIDHPDRPTTIKIQKLFESKTANPMVGRSLRRTFRNAGLEKLVLRAVPIVMTKPKDISLDANIKSFVAEGLIEERTAKKWMDSVKKLADEGSFLCTLTTYIVRGIRPEGEIAPLTPYESAYVHKGLPLIATATSTEDDEEGGAKQQHGVNKEDGEVPGKKNGEDNRPDAEWNRREKEARSRGKDSHDRNDRERRDLDRNEDYAGDDGYDDDRYDDYRRRGRMHGRGDDDDYDDYDRDYDDDRRDRYPRHGRYYGRDDGRRHHHSRYRPSRHSYRDRSDNRNPGNRKSRNYLRSNSNKREAAGPPHPMAIQEAMGRGGSSNDHNPAGNASTIGNRVNEFTFVTKDIGAPKDNKSSDGKSLHKEDRKKGAQQNINRDSGVLDGDEDDDDSAGVVTLH
jgi:ubiquinone/menaquinone biosynthesis C-methylase UbiE